jgi:phosphoribosylaminoimidazole-succinocarboxamide synthase
VLNQTARFWFDQTADICPNHVISYPDPNVAIVKHLNMLPIEMVVRDYLTGSTDTSIWPMYERGERLLYGHKFPDGLKKSQKLPQTIITPTTKAEQGEHDAPITAEEIVKQKLLTQAQWDELSRLALAVFARGREIAAKNGLILVDTKYEFGTDPETGKITLADEIHTPDSSRYWIAETYQKKFETGANPDSLDKEFLRLWINARCDPYKDPIPEIPAETLIEFSEKYIRLYEQVTGKTFERASLDTPLRERIRNALKKELPEYFKN